MNPQITEEIGDPGRVDAVSERSEERSPSVCLCGAAFVQPLTGRKRLTCSLPCQRRRDGLVRKIKWRRAALDLWRAQRRTGHYTQAQIRTEMKVLRDELDALERELHGGRTE